MFDNNEIIKSWSSIKQELGLNNTFNFKMATTNKCTTSLLEKIIKEPDDTNNLLRADPAFIIREGPLQKYFYQIIANYSKEASSCSFKIFLFF